VNDADRLARLEKAALRCLELLEAGRSEEACRELAVAVRRPGPANGLGGELTDLELERAFERARPVAEEVVDADRVAQQAIREADRELAGRRPAATFATRTMAELLERQGDAAGARRIRAALAAQVTPGEARAAREVRSEARAAREAVQSEARAARDAPGAARATPTRRDRGRVLATLERWLENVRRGV
jgi:hypothetical protein